MKTQKAVISYFQVSSSSLLILQSNIIYTKRNAVQNIEYAYTLNNIGSLKEPNMTIIMQPQESPAIAYRRRLSVSSHIVN